jgi:hypothetical protein
LVQLPVRKEHLPIGHFLERQVAKRVRGRRIGSFERGDVHRLEGAQIVEDRRLACLPLVETHDDIRFEDTADDAGELQHQSL